MEEAKTEGERVEIYVNVCRAILDYERFLQDLPYTTAGDVEKRDRLTGHLQTLRTIAEHLYSIETQHQTRKRAGACGHERLHALRKILDGKDYMDEIVESLIAVRAGHNDINTDCILCPECLLIVSAEKFKSGEWSA